MCETNFISPAISDFLFAVLILNTYIPTHTHGLDIKIMNTFARGSLQAATPVVSISQQFFYMRLEWQGGGYSLMANERQELKVLEDPVTDINTEIGTGGQYLKTPWKT